MTSRPANSPCAPEFGCNDTAARPVISASAASRLAEDVLIPGGLLQRRERVHARELRPAHRHHLGRGVELHRARAERNHRRVEPEVLALELPDVAHHLGLGVMRVEHRVGQVARRPAEIDRRARGRLAVQRHRGRLRVPSANAAARSTRSTSLTVSFKRHLHDALRRIPEVDPERVGRSAHAFDALRRRPRGGSCRSTRALVCRQPSCSSRLRQRARPARARAWRSRSAPRGRDTRRRTPPCWRAAPAPCRCSTSPSRGGCAARASAAPCDTRGGPGCPPTRR